MMKKILALISLWLFAVAAYAAEWPQQLNITYVKAPFNIQNMVMKKQQLLEKEFEKEGIQINWIPIKAGINQVRGMAAGEIDMVAAMNTSTLLIANSADNKILIVDGVAHPDETFAIMASPAIKTVADLKDRQIVGPKGTVLHHMLVAALQKEGMSIGDVRCVSMNLPSSLTTLIGGRSDAALLAGAGILNAQKAGFHELVRAKGLIETNLVLAVRQDFAERYPEVVKRVAKVNREALQWAQAHKAEAIQLGASEHGIDLKDAEKLYEWSNFYSQLSDSDLTALKASQAFLLEQKMIKTPVDLSVLFFQ